MEHILERKADFEAFKNRKNMYYYLVKYFVKEGLLGNHDGKESMVM